MLESKERLEQVLIDFKSSDFKSSDSKTEVTLEVISDLEASIKALNRYLEHSN